MSGPLLGWDTKNYNTQFALNPWEHRGVNMNDSTRSHEQNAVRTQQKGNGFLSFVNKRSYLCFQ